MLILSCYWICFVFNFSGATIVIGTLSEAWCVTFSVVSSTTLCFWRLMTNASPSNARYVSLSLLFVALSVLHPRSVSIHNAIVLCWNSFVCEVFIITTWTTTCDSHDCHHLPAFQTHTVSHHPTIYLWHFYRFGVSASSLCWIHPWLVWIRNIEIH